MQPLVLLVSLLLPDVIGLAAVYGYPGDALDKEGPPACEATLVAERGRAGFQKMLEAGVAHRQLPCGTKLRLVSLTGSTSAFVVDRGPFGIRTATGRWRAGRTLRQGEQWRGVLDLRPPVARNLGFMTGLHPVAAWVEK